MSNKQAKEELIKAYGAECFIEKLHLRKDKKPRVYTGKAQMKRMKQLTYHHVIMKKDRRQGNKRKPGFCFHKRIILGFTNKVHRRKDI